MSERFRYFTVDDTATNNNCAAVFGGMKVIYEKDPSRNLYGTTVVELYFPVKKEIKHSFPLDLYPVPRSNDKKEENIEDEEVAFGRLWQEANRAARLLAQSAYIALTKDNKHVVNYKDIHIIPEDMLDESDEPRLWGYMTRDIMYLRKGDVVELMFLQDNPWQWYVKYDPDNHGTSLKEKLRKMWLRMFNKGEYESRYVFKENRTMSVSIEDIRVIGSPVEPGTER